MVQFRRFYGNQDLMDHFVENRIAGLDPDGAFFAKLLDSAAPAVKVFMQQLGTAPEAVPSVRLLDQDRVSAGRRQDLSAPEYERLRTLLQALKPWRKGPFSLFGIDIDSEWDSALKWRRVAPHIKPLAGRRVLDVGSSNGYYLYRMAPAQPHVMVGIEPYLRYYAQFRLLQHYLQTPRLYCLPIRLEQLGGISGRFDTIFCMGVLYHRRDPLETLTQLKKLMAPAGELILETLILQGGGDRCLCPEGRYAAMRNVFFIPTVTRLVRWLDQSGFRAIRCVDQTATTLAEQRKTDWIDSRSLESFLDPQNPSLTIEGHPSPVRAVFIAAK